LKSLRDWNPGDSNKDRSHFQEPVDALRELDRMAGRPEGRWVQTRAEYLCKVIATPSGQSAVTGARYWVQEQLIVGADYGAALTLEEDTSKEALEGEEPNEHVATNIAELTANTHLLHVGSYVYVTEWTDWGTPNQRHHLFSRPVRSFWASITGNSSIDTTHWKYAWAEQSRTETGFQNRTGGKTGSTSTDFGINAAEAVGTAFAAVPTGTVVLMTVDSQEDGTIRYTFSAEASCDSEAVDHNVGTTAETEAAQTDDYDSEADGPHVAVTQMTRMAYDHAGSELLFAYYRTFTYRCGKLYSVSAETRVTIDTPEDCP
jgi:hypothetical protein